MPWTNDQMYAVVNKPQPEEIRLVDLINKPDPEELMHFGILGQKWGVRRYQNPDGSLTPEGEKRYSDREKDEKISDAMKDDVKRSPEELKELSKKYNQLQDDVDKIHEEFDKELEKIDKEYADGLKSLDDAYSEADELASKYYDIIRKKQNDFKKENNINKRVTKFDDPEFETIYIDDPDWIFEYML